MKEAMVDTVGKVSAFEYGTILGKRLFKAIA